MNDQLQAPGRRQLVDGTVMRQMRKRLLAYTALTGLAVNTVTPAMAAAIGPHDGDTTTPIKHVIIIVGENRSFDHLFATYVPPTGTVSNLLSKGIITSDGAVGPHWPLAAQYSAVDTGTFSTAPGSKKRYTVGGATAAPPIMTGGAPPAQSDTFPPFKTYAEAQAADQGLPTPFLDELTNGATGLPTHSVDTREPNAAYPGGIPFQLTPGISYDDYASSPVHRFYQMFQQMDCSASYATAANPSGCLNDLYPWVEVSVGAGSNGKAQPSGFNDKSTGEGSTAMGFYNVQWGDVPYFTNLADDYAIGDNYHQPAKGGTGADSVYLGFASDVWYANRYGNPVAPPSNQIENPDPQAGTNNYYKNDGYSGGTYTNCSDLSQPGVAPIVTDYMAKLPYKVSPNCQAKRYYLLNNYNPGYYGDGSAAPLGPNVFTIPPVSQPSIANVLDKAGVSWTYYGEGWNAYVANKPNAYCNICNPFQYQTYIMTGADRTTNLKDTSDLYADISEGKLPAVSYVKPDGLNDGHPASSKFDIFEAFTYKIVAALQAQPDLWASTAVMITVDEGGGYYDSGFIQTVDFFGDGTRIPMIVVSPYSKGVGVVHTYGDHASFIKFVEKNWKLPKITTFTRDNLPNPTSSAANPYVPTNMPAIDDLMTYFKFPK